VTSGSIVQDYRGSIEDFNLQYPGPVKTSHGFKLYGPYFSKVWSGANRTVKKTYEKYYWNDPYGRQHVRRRRTDTPTRSKFDPPHNYTCSIINKTSGWYGYSEYLFGSPNKDSYIQRETESTYGTGFSSLPSDEWNSNDDLALIGRLREKVAGSDFNMGVFLGESRQGLDMIAGSATRIFNAYKKVKRGDIYGAARSLQAKKPTHIYKDVASNWLELQYGWLPLLQDVKAAAEFLAKNLEYPMIKRYKVRMVKRIPLTRTTSEITVTESWAYTQGQIIANVSEASVPALLGLFDPASVAWELLPYSFVADWFLPIGDYLSARALASSLTAEYVTTKTRRVNFGFHAPVLINSNPNVRRDVIDEDHGFQSYHQVDMTRTVSTTLVIPLPSFKTLDKVTSWRHCANAVGLLVQNATYTKPMFRNGTGPRYYKWSPEGAP